MRKSGKKSGFTLAEVLVAMAVLMLIMAPMMGLIHHVSTINARTTRLQVAQLTAQLRLEELIGRTQDDIMKHLDANYTTLDSITFTRDDVFPVTVIISPVSGFTNLLRVVVSVDYGGGNFFELENILNVVPGGDEAEQTP
jgi:prepilin-type N-terminal cleavage/methylation domain-containing protein